MADFQPHEAPATDAQALPVMHPGRPVGRDDILRQVYTHLKDGQAVLLHGDAGAGKTALAAALASAYTAQPGGVLWLQVDNSPLAELIVRVGRAYNALDIANSDNPIGMVGAVANLLTQHKPFIVLDGQLNPQGTSQFMSRCAENLPALLTHAEDIDGPWTAIEVGALADGDAAVLFKQKAGIADNSSDIDVYGIVKLLDYQALSISIAARAMVASKSNPGAYFKVLQQVKQAVGSDATSAALTAAFRPLTGALQGLILMMGATFGGQASAELLSVVSGAPLDSVNQAMTVLSQLHLVERITRYNAPYYRLHALVYRFAQDRLRESNNLGKLQEKVRDSALAYAAKCSSEGAAAYEKLATDMDLLINVGRWASADGDRDTPNKLVVALTQAGDFVNDCGYVYELLSLRSSGSGFTTAFPAYGDEEVPADLLDDDEDEDTFDAFDDAVEFDEVGFDEDFDDDFDSYDEDEFDEDDFEDTDDPFSRVAGMGSASTATDVADTGSLDSIDQNQLRAALTQARQQHNILRQIQILKAIGKVQVSQNMENEAISSYNEALDLYEETDDDSGLLEVLDKLSALLAKNDSPQAAVLHASRGVTLAEEQGDSATRMRLLLTLGEARQELGETQEAIQVLNRALDLARSHDDAQHEAIALYKLGYTQLDDGDPDTAIDTLEEALKLFRSQDRRDYQGRVLSAIGTAHAELEHWSEAITFHTSALHIAREVKDKEEESLVLSSLGQALLEAGKLPDALLRYRQALYLAYQSGKRDNIVSAIVDLVELMLRSKRLLSICELLITDALKYEPNDKDVLRLQERVTNEKALAQANGVQMAEVRGTAEEYGERAYALLES